MLNLWRVVKHEVCSLIGNNKMLRVVHTGSDALSFCIENHDGTGMKWFNNEVGSILRQSFVEHLLFPWTNLGNRPLNMRLGGKNNNV